MPSEEASQMASPNYLLGSVAHVHCVVNPVFQEAPSVLEVWGRVLHHHQLCRVVDASQHSSAGIPVKLQRNPPGKSPLLLWAGEVWGFLPKATGTKGSLLISFPHRCICFPARHWCSQIWLGNKITGRLKCKLLGPTSQSLESRGLK